ncbi:hypothetical protein JOB18_025820, partial [Solea senegalensis]
MTQQDKCRRSAPQSSDQSEKCVWAQLLVRCVFGAISGAGLFLGVSHSLPLTFDLKLAVGSVFVGPVSNMERNVRAAALSLSCNLDLQVHHSRLLWRDAVSQYTHILKELQDDKAEFESDALNVSRRFQIIRDEVVAQYGYNQTGNSSQERFTTQTMMQCDRVVTEGVNRCSDWFRGKWEECMQVIAVPVINHVFCVPMTFHFLCDVMR